MVVSRNWHRCGPTFELQQPPPKQSGVREQAPKTCVESWSLKKVHKVHCVDHVDRILGTAFIFSWLLWGIVLYFSMFLALNSRHNFLLSLHEFCRRLAPSPIICFTPKSPSFTMRGPLCSIVASVFLGFSLAMRAKNYDSPFSTWPWFSWVLGRFACTRRLTGGAKPQTRFTFFEMWSITLNSYVCMHRIYACIVFWLLDFFSVPLSVAHALGRIRVVVRPRWNGGSSRQPACSMDRCVLLRVCDAANLVLYEQSTVLHCLHRFVCRDRLVDSHVGLLHFSTSALLGIPFSYRIACLKQYEFSPPFRLCMVNTLNMMMCLTQASKNPPSPLRLTLWRVAATSYVPGFCASIFCFFPLLNFIFSNFWLCSVWFSRPVSFWLVSACGCSN